MRNSNTERVNVASLADCHAGEEACTRASRGSRAEPQLWENSKRKSFQAKEVIYREGDRVDRVCIIRSGLVKLLSYLPNGRARIVRLHVRDQWLGLEGFLGEPYEHTAIAVGDVHIQYLSVHNLQHLVMSEPQRLLQLQHQWHLDLAQADRWISEFSTGGIRPRVARLLQFLAELEHGEDTNRVELLTVCEMSEVLGVTPESVSRIVATFKRREILQKLAETHPYREIYRVDSQRLLQEALA